MNEYAGESLANAEIITLRHAWKRPPGYNDRDDLFVSCDEQVIPRGGYERAS